MKTGPYKPAPHIPQGFYIAAEDRTKYVIKLRDAFSCALAMQDDELQEFIADFTRALMLSKELPSLEEQTIKARMDMKATLPAYPDGETLDAQVSANLLR